MAEVQTEELRKEAARHAVPALKAEPFSSNGVRLTRNEWLLVMAFTLALYVLTPAIWKRADEFAPGADYRMPFSLSQDYWFFQRYAERAVTQYDTVVVGDSVIWGQYVTREQTLTHYLNEQCGAQRFANLGLNGSHPMALAGLLEHYGQSISGKNVVLHFNLLWLSSPKHDLSIEDEFRFNHPQLVPQFSPWIACYKEQISTRLGITAQRNSPFSGWTNHLQAAYFNESDIPAWTLAHPYECPLGKIDMKLPTAGDPPQQPPVPWTTRTQGNQDLAWVQPQQSLQWQAFQRALKILQQRNNDVLVLVTPFNEHMLSSESHRVYQGVHAEVTQWLSDNKVRYVAPSVLPSELYGDGSHPLAEGYRVLAREMLNGK
ncbi:MAG TPA: hypothetical protein VGP72_28820 [Planctomycetota bacterium]|jgi:hypothetical protein